MEAHRDVTLFRQVKRTASAANFKINEPIADIQNKRSMYCFTVMKRLVKRINSLLWRRQSRPSLKVMALWVCLHDVMFNYVGDGIRKWAEEFMAEEICSPCRGFRLQKEESYGF